MQGKFIVHEWGTFLAIAGSDGVNLEGMYHEEHPLPTFVHAPKEDTVFSRIATLKGETPVIYFYTDRPRRVSVGVDFPTGTWTHWFPSAQRVGRYPGPHPTHNGHIAWIANIKPPSPQDRLPTIAPDSLWRFARQVPQAATVHMTPDARLLNDTLSGFTPVPASGETERFLFYRGLGKADLPVRFFPEVNGGQLTTTVPVRSVIVVNVTKGKITWRAFESLSPKQKLEGITQRLKPGTPEAVAQRLTSGLVESGLFPDEAKALVNTWKSSYFGSDGLRVLFILPPSWTEKFIPMRVFPKPDQLTRVMVGRIEGLTREREAAVAEALQSYAAAPEKHFATLAAQGRYLEPILRRLATQESLRQPCEKLLASAFVATGQSSATEVREALLAR
ncbi:hypothetical protein [Armatimonas sp.]|uniref:hypothetical protein n=1 Tax=Armatimonas sp. TaxID=1872638 RepID=UPI00286B1CE5|nr:hypothetical protein [Armatimonas sp.]